MEVALRYILPLYLVIYFLAAFLWRSLTVWRRTGVNPFVLGNTNSAYDLIGKMFKIVFALIAAAVILFSVSESLCAYLMPITWLQHHALVVIGLTLLSLSLVWTLLAQSQMGESWRIGIDQEHETALVQSGIFRLSRSPIFLGMMITLLGLFLMIPNALTLLAFVLGVVLIEIQVRLEEEHLKALHGDTYDEYCRSIRRWI
jgi:protein-S-isoprenylcysteine O-methyltransferase Ste14